jgi:hypothetical protein
VSHQRHQGRELGARAALGLLLALSPDDPDGHLVREEKVIDGTDVRRVFPHRDPAAGMDIDMSLILNEPARGEKEFVYPVPGALFGIMVHNWADCTTLDEDADRSGDPLNRALGMVKGRIADAMMRLANRFIENDIPWPYLLEAILRRLAAEDHPAIRAMVVHHLPFLISRRPQTGWLLFDKAMNEAVGLWQVAERCLYYSYHADYASVRSHLDRLLREGAGKDLETWGRIVALTTLDRSKPLAAMLENLLGLAGEDAWTGAAQVWSNGGNIQSCPDICIEGLRAGLRADGTAAVVVAHAVEHMYEQVETAAHTMFPVDLFISCLEILQRNESQTGHDFWRLAKWLISCSRNHPDEVLEMALHYARFMRGKGQAIYDHADQYPKLLTLLFREAEERDVADGGIMMRDVLELQDMLASIGVNSIEGWLRDAERH